MTKHTYQNAKNKKAIRDFLFERFKMNKIVGLAGPDINDYIKWCKSKGYDDIEIWENEPAVMMKQLMETKSPVSYKFGNILNTSIEEKTFYDLDYCVSVRYMKDHIQKFDKNFIMTFSTRIGVQETIDKFFKFRREKIVKEKEFNGPGLRNVEFTTDKGKYLFITYCDTSAMCCIAKVA